MALEDDDAGEPEGVASRQPGARPPHHADEPLLHLLRHRRGHGPRSGPIGAASVPLTPLPLHRGGPLLWAYGLPFWISASTCPLAAEPEPFRRLMIAQDTGSAILGPPGPTSFSDREPRPGRRPGSACGAFPGLPCFLRRRGPREHPPPQDPDRRRSGALGPRDAPHRPDLAGQPSARPPAAEAAQGRSRPAVDAPRPGPRRAPLRRQDAREVQKPLGATGPRRQPSTLAAADASSRRSRRWRRRLRSGLSRGNQPIDAVIDLHGLRQEEAHDALRGFLHAAQRRGDTVVLVVTGKGGAAAERLLFEERGVLRRTVPHWLRLPDLRAVVVGFEEAVAASWRRRGALCAHPPPRGG